MADIERLVDEAPITLIIGASSGIAQAVAQQMLQHEQRVVYRVSRSTAALEKHALAVDFESDYSEISIREVVGQLSGDLHRVERIIICNGLLHNAQVFPEKQLREFDIVQFESVMHTNATVPMLWLQALTAELTAKQACSIAILSARVGSISDNRLGGWYSYRASKAALNMLIKTASLELKRTHPSLSLMLFHPGTTDTELSKPFQQRVAAGKLFKPEFVASCLLEQIEVGDKANKFRYVDWAGEPIEF